MSASRTESGSSFRRHVLARIRPVAAAVLLSVLVVAVWPATAGAQSDPLINEFVANHTGADTEAFVEVFGDPSTDYSAYTVLEIEGDGSGAGTIDAVLPVGTTNAGGYWTDPEDMENGTLTILLVEGFTGTLFSDLDLDNDGTLDSTPWTRLVDDVAVTDGGSSDRTYSSTVLAPGFDGNPFTPGGASRIPNGTDTDSVADWVRNDFDGAGLPGFIGTPEPGEALNTRDLQNRLAGVTDPLINEFVANHTGADIEAFVEVFGDPSTDYSAYTVLEIEGDGSGAGTIDAVLPVGTTNAGGYWTDPEDMENGTLTILLVEGFTGTLFDDLDLDNDGTLDSTPWTRLVDDVAVTDGGSSDRTYSSTVLAPGFDGNPFTPGGASRIPNGTDTDSVADWLRNDFDGEGLPGFIGTPAVGEALNTPDEENQAVTPPATDPLINEFVFNHTGSDTHEFVEVFGDPSTDYSAFTVVEIEGDSGGAGLIDDGTFTVGVTDAAGFWDSGFQSNVWENGTVTLLLVENFTGTVGDDIDTDNDGVIDVTFWDRIVDTVAVDDGGSSDRTYGVTLFRGYDGNPFTVGGASRIPNGTDTDSDGDWVRNDFDGAGLPGFTGSPDFGEALNTPGAVNQLPSLLVINEIDYDQPGSDVAEFIELKNVSSSSIGLGGLELRLVNGSTTAIYNTIALPAVSLAAGDYFVVCADAATVVNCDLDVTPDGNLIQNGSPDAVALVDGTTIVDTVSYEGDTGAPYTEGSGAGLADNPANAFAGISRLPDGTDTNQNNVDFGHSCVTPGLPNSALLVNCGPAGPTFEIYEIQGAGSASPFATDVVTTEDNVVTAVGPDGFFIQTPTARTDGDVDTSDGIFVFTGGAPGVAVGDLVDVTGQVIEFFGLTEFSNGPVVTGVGSGPLPAPVTFGSTVPSPDPTAPSCAIEFECYEGMRVAIVGGTVTGPNQRFGPDPIAEVHITAAPARAFREPGIAFPGIFGFPVWDGNPEVFELDPDRLGLPNAIIPAGSSFDATGVLGFEFGGYELWPTSLAFTPAPLPVPVRPREAGEFTVGTLNLFRLFDDVDDPPSTNPQGAIRNDFVVSTAEYLRRRAKFAAYIVDVLDAPDVLAVQEAEKIEVLQALAGDIAALDASLVYTAYLEEGNDVGTIDNGFLVRDTVRVDAVTQLGALEILSFDGSLLHDRPPLLLEGAFLCDCPEGESPIQVMAVHNRSLGGIDSPSDGPRVRQKRLEQAESIAVKVQAIQDADPGARLVVAGDFNAFEFTDGYVHAVGHIQGDFDPGEELVCDTNPCPDLVDPNLANRVLDLAAAERYSFIFRGSAQVLDHALTSEGLDFLVRGTEYGRGNADAAVDLINDLSTPLRSSDHDGLVLYLMSDCDDDGVADDLDVCACTAIPEGVPTVRLGVNRFALVTNDTVFDTTSPSGVGPRKTFTTQDTAGCSCEQIIAAQGLGAGHTKFGCSIGAMEEWVRLVNPSRLGIATAGPGAGGK